MGLASCTFISSPQQTSCPSPALVQSASVPHFAQRYLFPNWLAIINLPQTVLLFDFHGLAAAHNSARAALGDNHFSAALGAAVSLAYRISHNLSPLCVIFVLYNYKTELLTCKVELHDILIAR
jgi:hypothetical protein